MRLRNEDVEYTVKKYIENYEFIKKVLQEIQIFREAVSVLYDTANKYYMIQRITLLFRIVKRIKIWKLHL